jgi:hypothetical protein
MSPISSLLPLALLYLPTINALAANISGTYHQYAAASYGLVATYNSGNFFSEFNFYTGADPTNGYVSYQSQSAAQSQGLINTNNGQIYMGVDSTTVNPSAGRASVRVSSNEAFTHGLFIADIAHMPGSICGVWPAYWLFGPNWPNSGEIDVIEGVNLAGTDTITLHTAAGCTINTAGSQSGTVLQNSNCNADNANTGCGVTTTTANAYGNGFNDIGGGEILYWNIGHLAKLTISNRSVCHAMGKFRSIRVVLPTWVHSFRYHRWCSCHWKLGPPNRCFQRRKFLQH